MEIFAFKTQYIIPLCGFVGTDRLNKYNNSILMAYGYDYHDILPLAICLLSISKLY